jgi:hypothetical protein
MTSVYLIRAGKTDNYKIGIADNVDNRLSNLQSANYENLSLIGSVEFDTRFIALVIEQNLHGEYKSLNTRGEWFRFSNDEISTVEVKMKTKITEVLMLKAKVKELEAKLKDVRKDSFRREEILT